METVKIGLIGCGNISAQYIRGLRMYQIIDLAACADMMPERAQERATEFDISIAYTVEQLLADPEIKIVVNLTTPDAHAAVSLAAIEAGKHVYSEKPLAITPEDGQKIVAAARAKGVRVGCAPDTFLGGGLQTARKLIDDGAIGRPAAAVAFMASHGPESWHPNPFFYYAPGGGPMLDMGPYYLTALVALLGPAKRVAGINTITFPERVATSEALYGQKINVDVPTHVTGAVEFASGAVGTVITSFDVWSHNLPLIEIYGSEGSLSVPDPNRFGGAVRVRNGREGDWEDIPLTHPDHMVRGIGVADMAHAMQSGRPHRASGDLAYHILELMTAFAESSASGQHITLASTVDQPAPIPTGLPDGLLD